MITQKDLSRALYAKRLTLYAISLVSQPNRFAKAQLWHAQFVCSRITDSQLRSIVHWGYVAPALAKIEEATHV